MKKRILKIVVVVVVLVVVLVAGSGLYLGPVIKTAVTAGGPAILKVPVNLESCHVGILQGAVSLKGLKVGSPEGFKADSVFSLGEVSVQMSPGSVMTDTIRIQRIYIKAPAITYEQALTGNNIGKLLDQMGGGDKPRDEASADAKPASDDQAAKPGKKVVIDEVVVEDGQIKVAVAALGGRGLPVPLPTIRLTDIGKEKGGATPAEALQKILTAVLTSVTSAVGAAADLVGDGAKAGAKVVGELGKGAADAAGAAGQGAIDAAGAVGKGAADAVGAVGQGAVDAAGAVGEKAGKVVEGLGGLLGGKKD